MEKDILSLCSWDCTIEKGDWVTWATNASRITSEVSIELRKDICKERETMKRNGNSLHNSQVKLAATSSVYLIRSAALRYVYHIRQALYKRQNKLTRKHC